jgi:N-acetylmuramoyl-L-alanine amidase
VVEKDESEVIVMFRVGRALKTANNTQFSSRRASDNQAPTRSTRPGRMPNVTAFAILWALIVTSGYDIAMAMPVGGAADPTSPRVTAIEMARMSSEASERLSQMGYYRRDVKSEDTAQTLERLRLALLAFQRVQGRNQTGTLDQTEVEALRTASAPVPRETGYSHVEVDLDRQVLFMVDSDGCVSRVLPISSGSGKLFTSEGKTRRAVTPTGRFTVYSKIRGWRKAPLGMIFYPCYFNKGIAIHGSRSVPNYAASHGCIRIPMSTAKELSEMLSVGVTVLVYSNDKARS